MVLLWVDPSFLVFLHKLTVKPRGPVYALDMNAAVAYAAITHTRFIFHGEASYARHADRFVASDFIDVELL